MKKLLLFTSLLTVASASVCKDTPKAATATKETAAQKAKKVDTALNDLMEAMNIKEMFNQMTAMFKNQANSGQVDAIKSIMGSDELENIIKKIYKDNLTLDEINTIIDFYKSSAYKKILKITPEVQQQTMTFINKKMTEAFAKESKDKKAPAAPTTKKK